MSSSLYIQPFCLALALSLFLGLILLSLPHFQYIVWRKGKRHHGKDMVIRLGGVALYIGFLASVFLDHSLVITREISGLIFGGFFVLGAGLFDDFRELSVKAQGLVQVGATLILYIFGIHIAMIKTPFGTVWSIPDQSNLAIFLGFGLLLLWLVLILNTVNWLDGSDGLLGGVSFVTFVTIFLLSLKPEVNQPPIAILASIGAGVTVGFLFFNMYPAKILAGTSGSLFLGFFIATLATIAGTKIATALLVLALPVTDALFVIGERLWAGDSIFQPDERHLHYKLRRLGWSERRIAWFFFTITALIALVALNTDSLGKFSAFLLVEGGILSLLAWITYDLHGKSSFQSSL